MVRPRRPHFWQEANVGYDNITLAARSIIIQPTTQILQMASRDKDSLFSKLQNIRGRNISCRDKAPCAESAHPGGRNYSGMYTYKHGSHSELDQRTAAIYMFQCVDEYVDQPSHEHSGICFHRNNFASEPS